MANKIGWKSYKVIESDDLFGYIRETTGKDVEGYFNERHCPPCEGCVSFYIEREDALYDETEELSETDLADKAVYEALKANGFADGEFIYIRFDY